MIKTQSDEVLFSSNKEGDEHAFENFFNIHNSSLCQKIVPIVKEKQIVEELISDVFYTIWRKRESIQIKSNIVGYLHFAARNHALNYLKTKKTGWVDLEEVAFTLSSSMSNPEEKIISEEIIQLWEEKIKRLPEQRQKVFRMSRLEGLTYAEIAKKLDLSENTVRNQVQIAVQSLICLLALFKQL